MDLLCHSSDSDGPPLEYVGMEDLKRSSSSEEEIAEDVLNVDCGIEKRTAINDSSDSSKKSQDEMEAEDEIENYVIPPKRAKRAKRSAGKDDSNKQDATAKNGSEIDSAIPSKRAKGSDGDKDFNKKDATAKNGSEIEPAIPSKRARSSDADEDYNIQEVTVKNGSDIDSEIPNKRAKSSDGDEDYNIQDTTAKNGSDIKDDDNDSGDSDITLVYEKIINRSNELDQMGRPSVIFMNDQDKLDKEKEKEDKKAEQLKQKAEKAALSENQRNLKPEENIKFYKVHIDNEIINSVYGGHVIWLLQQNSIQYVVENQIKSYTITWSKRRIIKVANDSGELIDTIESKDIEQIMYVMDWERAVNLVHTDEMLDHLETVRNICNKHVTLVIYGLEKYFNYKKSQINRGELFEKKSQPKPSDKIYEDAPYISKNDFDIALLELQVGSNHSFKTVETPEELSTLVLNYTKSLARVEAKLEKLRRQRGDSGWYTKGDSAPCVKVDRNGNGLMRLWQQQVSQFNSVGSQTAEAVVSNFHSPTTLVGEYERRGRQEEREMLLQDVQIRRDAGILSSARRVGPQLSKKIYNFFMNETPDNEL